MNENNNCSTQNEDFPALFCVADSASINAQKRYLILFRLDLLFLILGAFFSSISFSTNSGKFTLFFLGGISFLASLFLTIAIKNLGFEKTWYGGRAIAESVKTLAWRYMICAEPYLINIDSKEVDTMFRTNLENILKERRQLLGEFTEEIDAQPQITPRMREVRALNTDERKKFYIQNRVLDQRKWYSKKAKFNRINENRWFFAVMSAQFVGGISAFILVSYPEFPVNLTSIFSTVAMGFLAWLQVKRHQEQSQSYNVAAQELASIADVSLHVETDEGLASFVADAENAISREHTLWIARRDQLI